MSHFFKLKVIALPWSICYVLTLLLALEKLQRQSQNDVSMHFSETSLLVVAHPDDETMFFGPTIINLLSSNKSIVILCLTNGNADAVGKKRQQELSRVVDVLGPNVSLTIVDDPHLPDSMVTKWATNRVVDHIEKQLRSNPFPIRTLITFDSYGVSGHINHISINQSIKLLRNRVRDLNIKFLTLKSVNIWRKYILTFLEPIITHVSNALTSNSLPSSITMSVDLSQYYILRQTLQIHESQMLWFRQLYMIVSRYMLINDLEIVK